MSEDIADSVIARVLELGYLDDKEYTLRKVRLMAEKGYGDFSIRMSLEAMDIPDDMAEKALRMVSHELSEEKRMSMLMDKRTGLGKEKMLRYLASKGFPFEKIVTALGGDDQ